MIRSLLAAAALTAGALTALSLQPATALSCFCGAETWELELVSASCEDCAPPATAELYQDDYELSFIADDQYTSLAAVEE